MTLFRSDFGHGHGEVLRAFVHEFLNGRTGLRRFAMGRPGAPPEHFRWYSEGFVEWLPR